MASELLDDEVVVVILSASSKYRNYCRQFDDDYCNAMTLSTVKTTITGSRSAVLCWRCAL